MRKHRQISIAFAWIFSAVAALTPGARASLVENLVFRESASQLVETLNGVQIGDWDNTGSYQFKNASSFGNLAAQPGKPGEYGWLEFSDPDHGGDQLFISLLGYMGNSHGVFLGDVTPMAGQYVSLPGTVFPDASTELPYGVTGATVSTAGGPVDVNISFVDDVSPIKTRMDNNVPESASTGGLLLIAGGALAAMRKRAKTA